MYPFPPVILAHHEGGASLIAQAYVSSHPAAGLVFLGPPSSSSITDPLEDAFNFELTFPLAVLATKSQFGTMGGERFDDPAVDKLILPQGKENQMEGQDAVTQIELWLDELGV